MKRRFGYLMPKKRDNDGKKILKIIGMSFIILGFLLATPPFSPIPDDFLNWFFAALISNFFNMPYFQATLFTYVGLSFIFIIVGALIFPMNTKRLLTKIWSDIHGFFKSHYTKAKRYPAYLIMLVLAVGLYLWFYSHIYQQLIMSGMVAG